MKRFVTTAAFAVFTLASASLALAQSNSVAGSSALSQTQSQSAASGNSIYLDQSTPATRTVKQSGTATLKTAPSLGSLALGGGHPCAYAPATGQISIIGGGAGFGGMTVDPACMTMLLAAQGYKGAAQATVNMIASGDRRACKAMYQAGMVSDCVGPRGNSFVKASPTVSSRSAKPATNVAAYDGR